MLIACDIWVRQFVILSEAFFCFFFSSFYLYSFVSLSVTQQGLSSETNENGQIKQISIGFSFLDSIPLYQSNFCRIWLSGLLD